MKTILLALLLASAGLTDLCAVPLVEQAPSAPPVPGAAVSNPPRLAAAQVAPRAAARPTYISPGAAEVVKMTQAGVEPAVIKDFVEHSPAAYAPGAAEIIYLRDEGVSSEIITALIKRGSVLRAEAMQSARANLAQTPAQPAAPTVVTAPQPVMVTQPVQTVAQPVYIYDSPRYVSYPYSYYYNNYYYTSPFAFRLGFYPRYSTWGGHFHSGHGFHQGNHFQSHAGRGFGAPYRPGFGAHFAAGPVRVGGSIHRR